MRRGKEIAQGAHASMIWLSQRIREPSHGFILANRWIVARVPGPRGHDAPNLETRQ